MCGQGGSDVTDCLAMEWLFHSSGTAEGYSLSGVGGETDIIVGVIGGCEFDCMNV